MKWNQSLTFHASTTRLLNYLLLPSPYGLAGKSNTRDSVSTQIQMTFQTFSQKSIWWSQSNIKVWSPSRRYNFNYCHFHSLKIQPFVVLPHLCVTWQRSFPFKDIPFNLEIPIPQTLSQGQPVVVSLTSSSRRGFKSTSRKCNEGEAYPRPGPRPRPWRPKGAVPVW